MCGLFGISGHPEAARMSYFGLYAQQHRGQESAGIATYDGEQMYAHANMGLVPDVFDERILGRKLHGHKAIGHIRYSTAGSSALRNAQPLVVRVRGIEIALAHNGNLTNAAELRTELENHGAIFQTNSDSEIFVHLIAHHLNDDMEQALIEACARVRGAYCLVVMTGGRLIAIRDAHGFHPLALGRVDKAWVLASETCAFDLLEAEFVRDIAPGEMLIIDGDNLCSKKLRDADKTPVRQCIFELVYFARPDSLVFGEDVYQCRKLMGFQLAQECGSKAELVMPFPDSGVYCAVGYAQGTGIPYEHAFIRNHYVGRTFIQPSQGMRDFGVRVKLNPVRSVINGKHICIIDDSIVRGTTVRTRVGKLREHGAKIVDFRVSCPPVAHPCYYGISFSSLGELVAANNQYQDLARLLNLDSLHYLTIEGLLRTVKHPEQYCLACFDGNYPVPMANADDPAARCCGTCSK